jgi:hypothetical protein
MVLPVPTSLENRLHNVRVPNVSEKSSSGTQPTDARELKGAKIPTEAQRLLLSSLFQTVQMEATFSSLDLFRVEEMLF